MLDMIFVNVSGQGIFNISGRDTFFLQVGSVEEFLFFQMFFFEIFFFFEIVLKLNREDVIDRFGKFEIRFEIESKDVYDC